MENIIREEKNRLIKELAEETGDGRLPLNVVVIGKPGCGKSSFINSFAASITTDRWREFAFSGKATGEARQITCRVKSLERTTYNRSSRLQNCALPTLIDLTGFEDEEGEITEEILRLVFYGKLADHSEINTVYQFGKQYGVVAMRLWYSLSPRIYRKVYRIIVLASAAEPIPEKLIRCLMRAARPRGNIYTREIPFFGVMTKFDQVDESSKDFKQRKQLFMESLALTGVGHRFEQCVNYCDTVDPSKERLKHTFADIDVPILRIMNVVCGFNYVVTNPRESYTGANVTRATRCLLSRMSDVCSIIFVIAAILCVFLGMFTLIMLKKF